MQSRRAMWVVPVGAAGMLAAAVALTAHGQDRPAGDPKYYQGQVTLPPPGMPTTAPVKTGGAPSTWGPPPVNTTTPGMGVTFLPPPGMSPPAGGSAAPGAMAGGVRPRITQPVVAGPDGVQPMTGAKPAPPTGGSPPYFPSARPPAPALPPPTLSVEPGPAAPPPSKPEPRPAGLPEPQPLSPGGDTRTPPNPLRTSQPALPVPQVIPQVTASKPTDVEPTPATAPAGLLSRQAPQVTVEAEFKEKDGIGVGQPWTYDLVVRNVGTAPVSNVRLDDELPLKATFVGSEPTAETGGDRLSWSLGTLEPGVEKRVKVTVRPGEEGELRSRATVTFSTSVEARVKVTRPRVTVAVTGPETSRVGTKVPFQIKLTNSGSGPASRVSLMARFSDGLTHPQGQVIEAELAGLKAGETRTLSLEADAVRGGPQNCVLTAAADGSAAESARATLTLVEPMLTVKQHGPARCLVKGEPTYQIELANPGTATTDPVVVRAVLPAGFEFVAATDGGEYQPTNTAVGWRLPGLAAGGSKTLTLKVRAVQPVDGAIRTVVVAVADPTAASGIVPVEARTGAKPMLLEARAETAVKAEGVPALRFEVVDVEDPIEVGKEAIYEVRVTNQGTGPCTNVRIVADLAEGTSYVAAQGVTNARPNGQQLVFEPIPNLGVKAEAVYRVRVKGTVAGDHRFRVRLACDQISTPVVKEENTRFYKE
ncbi:MAG: hypothetical protein U0871_29240 [Gemmataceae bacterium]